MLTRARVQELAGTTGVVAALLLGGCGEESSAPSAARTTPQNSTPVVPASTTSTAKGSELPSDREVAAAQQRPIEEPEDPEKLSPGLKQPRVQPGPGTAPAGAVDLAETATEQWLAYRINGDAPNRGVIPSRLWDSVPPASPALRAQGAALEGGVRAYEVQRLGGMWNFMVATRDPRLPALRVTIKRLGGGFKVTEVNG